MKGKPKNEEPVMTESTGGFLFPNHVEKRLRSLISGSVSHLLYSHAHVEGFLRAVNEKAHYGPSGTDKFC